jgi:membrane protease YdiL (CAAX protease family)
LNKRLRVFLKVVGIFLLLTGIWTLYRVRSANLIVQDEEMRWDMFFLTQIIFQPLLGLLPILLIVRYIEKRGLGSMGLSKRKLVGNALFGVLLSLFNYFVVICLEYVLLVQLAGGQLTLILNPENLDWVSAFFMPLTFFLAVGPSEEVQSRGYFQTRLLEHFGPRLSILFPSLLFALSHIPIDILIWRYDVWMMSFHLIGVFVSGCLLGYLYYRSGVLMGPIFLHAFIDTQSLTYQFSFNQENLGPGAILGLEALFWAISTILTFLLIRSLTSKLGLRVKNLPWETDVAEKGEAE